MNKWIDKHHAWLLSIEESNRLATGVPGVCHLVIPRGPWTRWLNEVAGTGLYDYLGWGPRAWWFWATNRELTEMLMDRTASPHALRLFDGRRKKWAGAEEAIRAQTA